MIADVDDDGSNEIDFGEFCKVIAKQKTDKAGESDESDTSARRLLAPLLLLLRPAAAGAGARRTLQTRSLPLFRRPLTPAHAPPLRAVDAFIALGGNADKTGNVQAEKLRTIIKEFGLTIDIDRLIREVDTDHSGLIDYQEFAVMMKS